MKYIGITGITKVSEIDIIKTLVKNRILMCGILVSYKILHGDNNSENKRYVNVADLYNVCKASHNAGFFTVLHYNTRNRISFDKELDTIMNTYKLHDVVDGFQLNIDIPNCDTLASLKQMYPTKKIIFSLNRDILYFPSENVLNLNFTSNTYLNAYFNTSIAKIIDYVLIDLSGGIGKNLDVNTSVNIYNALKQSKYSNNIGFAGGFNETNVSDLCLNIADRINSNTFSIDAESRLRTENNELDLETVTRYLQHYPF